MRKVAVASALLGVFVLANTAFGLDGSKQPVVVTPIKSTALTSTGQPIVLPQGEVEVAASIFEIAPGATLPVHKHPFPRYAYVLAGTLVVTNVDTGHSDTFKAGDFIVEMVDQWHQGSNIGPDPVKLVVIDQVAKGSPATVMRE